MVQLIVMAAAVVVQVLLVQVVVLQVLVVLAVQDFLLIQLMDL